MFLHIMQCTATQNSFVCIESYSAAFNGRHGNVQCFQSRNSKTFVRRLPVQKFLSFDKNRSQSEGNRFDEGRSDDKFKRL